jgi:ElaB/YqjD/DUF883 family membrane-anchored ribosome-binding protein
LEEQIKQSGEDAKTKAEELGDKMGEAATDARDAIKEGAEKADGAIQGAVGSGTDSSK